MASARLRPDWFLLGLVAAVALAFVAPHPGATGGWLHPEVLNKAGVALIFFLHGAALSFAAFKEGTLRWPLHLAVQATTFVVFPLLGLALRPVLGALPALFPTALATGVFFLCALPSTVSSSVALTAAAGGNVPAAVFNATLSNLLGVFVTPLWLAAVLNTAGQRLPVGAVIFDLCLWLVLPLGVGQLLRPFIGRFIARWKKYVSLVDRATILLLVYTSFCDSIVRGVWSGGDFGKVAGTFAVCAIVLIVILAASSAGSRAFGFSPADRITAIFCGSKKTLASGVPMAQLIFAGHAELSLILLPILIYHPLQLVVCGWLASRWAARAARPSAT